MARKLVICAGIFLSLFAGFFFLDNREDMELSKQGTGAETGVLRIQETDMDEVETAKTYVPFGSREYVRILPK